MELTTRLGLMNWLVSQGLTGLPETDLIRGFCERCRAGGLDLSRALAFIDTLHPIYEGRGFRWTDTATNESETFEYVSSSEATQRRTGAAQPFTTCCRTAMMS
jgi:adenylate cyclase